MLVAGHLEPGPVAIVAGVAQFASGADGLDPTDGFLEPFADPLNDVVAVVSGDAPVESGSSSRVS